MTRANSGRWAELAAAFLAWWRPRRLHLRGLSHSTLLVFGASVVSGVVSIVVLAGQSLGHHRSVGGWDYPLISDVPVAVTAALLLGFGTAVAALAGAALTLRRPARLVVLTLCLLPAGWLTARVRDDRYASIYDATPPLVTQFTTGAGVAMTTALLCAGAMTVLAGRAVVGPLGRTAVVAGHVLPYGAFATVWVLSLSSGLALVGAGDPRFPDPLPLEVLFESHVAQLGLILAGMAIVLTLWLAYAGGRATADIAGGVVGFVRRVAPPHWTAAPHGMPVHRWRLVAVVCGAKLTVHALPLLGVGLPMPGVDMVDADLSRDGWLSWLVATTIAGVVLAWLRAGAPGPRGEVAMLGAGAVVVVLLAGPEIVFQALAGGFAATGWEPLFLAAKWIEALQGWGYILTSAATGVLAIVLHRLRRGPAAVLLFGMVAFWLGVRVPVLVHELTTYSWFSWTIGIASESEFGQRPGWVDLTTVDVAVTVALFMTSIAALRGRELVPLGPTALVVVASTLLANSSLVLPDLFLVGAGLYLRFWVPLVYQLLFDAEGINEAGPARSRRLLLFGAVNALSLSVGALRGVRGMPAAVNDLLVAAEVVVPPVLAASVVMIAARGWASQSSTRTRTSDSRGPSGSASGSTTSVDSTASTSDAALSPG